MSKDRDVGLKLEGAENRRAGRERSLSILRMLDLANLTLGSLASALDALDASLEVSHFDGRWWALLRARADDRKLGLGSVSGDTLHLAIAEAIDAALEERRLSGGEP